MTGERSLEMLLGRVGDGRARRGWVALLARVSACVTIAALALTLGTSSASAETLCTDTWVGPTEGSWATAADWSTGVPTSSSVACIGSGDTVKVSEGTQQAGVVQDAGALALTGGSLEVAEAVEVSVVASLAVTGGTLTGAATIDVSGTLSWTGGTMSGAGSTVLEAGSTGTINPGVSGSVSLSQRNLVNEGTLTWSTGSVDGHSNAELENSGTFYANADATASDWENHGLINSDNSAVWFDNTGTIKKTAGAEYATIQFELTNTGTVVNETKGQIILYGGGHDGEVDTGSWSSTLPTGCTTTQAKCGVSFDGGSYRFAADASLSGGIYLSGGNIEAPSIQGPNADVTLWANSSTLTLTDSSTVSHLKSLTIKKLGSGPTTLAGAGTVEISGSFWWLGGSMKGSGKTVVQSGATGSIDPGAGETVALVERELVNEGNMTWASGSLEGRSNAELQNSGTFLANAQVSATEWETHGLLNSDKTNVWLDNTGTIEKTTGELYTPIYFQIKNDGAVDVQTGQIIFLGGDHASEISSGSWSASGSGELSFDAGSYNLAANAALAGKTVLSGGDLQAPSIQGADASVALWANKSTLTLTGTSTTSHLSALTLKTLGSGPTALSGSGTLAISGALSWEGGSMTGSGSTVLGSGASSTIESGTETVSLLGRSLVNEGTVTFATGVLASSENARITNVGTFNANSESGTTQISAGTGGASIVNSGIFEKTAGGGTTTVAPTFENNGTVTHSSGTLVISNPVRAESRTQYGTSNPSALGPGHPTCGKPVDCITGNETETQTDIEAGGRGVGLTLTRYYNAQAAAAGEHGAFGYGWSSSFSDHVLYNESAKTATIVQANGSTVAFAGEGSSWKAPVWTQDKLTGNSGEGYTLTLADQTVYKFTGTGRLESVADRNENTTSLTYNEKGQLATITDPSSRTIKLTYNGEGLVESATDPMGRVVKYTYESGNLATVTLPGQSSPRWHFKYDGSHRMTSMVNGIGGETTNTYNSSNQVVSQKGPAGHTLKWEYEAFKTKITNEATGSVTVEEYTSADELNAITHGYGTEQASIETLTYNEAGEPLTRSDGNGHTTSYEYNGEGDRVKQIDPEGHETKWTYNPEHEITSETLPGGETTSIEYDTHGNPVKISRPAPSAATQETRYEYNSAGEMTVMIDPLGAKWSYEYDEAGDRTSETNPEGDKTTWGYNEDSQQTSEVSPAGNIEGGSPGEYTTSIERNVLGQPVKVTRPEGRETSYEYNADGDQTTVTDANGHKTTVSYSSEDQPIKVTQPSGAAQETEYNGAGQIVKQTDGNKHATTYVRNVLGQVTETVNPLEGKTKTSYDAAGNLASMTSPEGLTTSYSYSKENQLSKISYSEAGAHAVEYEYTPDGQLASMSDGTGMTSYAYDQLGRLTETKDGHGAVVGYGYDLANEITQITYPNGKTIKDGYDKAGRLSSVTDWLSHTTSFSYTTNSQVAAEDLPEASGESDHYAYTRAGQLAETTMLKGSEALVSLVYKRDSLGQLTKATQTGLPGAEATEYAYDENEQLESAGGTGYEYDPAGNPTKIGAASNTFNAADELTEGGDSAYTYNPAGQRTKATPVSGPATSYGYDQAGNLISVARPEEGETQKIEDAYAYNGNNLRTSETIGGTTHYLTWQLTGTLPLLLSNGTDSYIYGPEGPVEQINNTEKVQYLHHDQAGSTRLITGSTGTVERLSRVL